MTILLNLLYNYICLSDFSSDKLTKFVGCLTTAAIACQRETVDRLCTDVLAVTNHITGVGGCVIDALLDRHRQGWVHDT